MKLNTDKYSDKVMIFVEGKSDVLFFEKLLNEPNIKFELSDGKQNAKKQLKKIKQATPKYGHHAIGICDADFDHLNNNKEYPPIFLTDTHDYETMILQDIGIKSLITEHCIDKFKLALNRNLLKNASNLTYQIGLIKWSNSKSSQFRLNFKDKNDEPLNLSEFIKFKDFDGKFDQDKYIERVMSQSAKQSQIKTTLLKEMQILELQQADKYQVCNGHDLAVIMALIICNYENQNNKRVLLTKLNQADIESNLRLSYNIDNFKKTDLYKQLKNWQTVNQMPKIVD